MWDDHFDEDKTDIVIESNGTVTYNENVQNNIKTPIKSTHPQNESRFVSPIMESHISPKAQNMQTKSTPIIMKESKWTFLKDHNFIQKSFIFVGILIILIVISVISFNYFESVWNLYPKQNEQLKKIFSTKPSKLSSYMKNSNN